MIFVNFKAYGQESQEDILRLAKICWEIEKETSVKVIPLVRPADVSRVADLGIEVWVQAVFTPGAAGVLLNHSDHKLSIETIGEEVERSKNQELKILTCCESIQEGEQIAEFKPDYLAYEPPELIGGEISVSVARPEIIADFVQEIKGIPLIVGAGIQKQTDVQKAIELGAKGVLVSHAVVASRDPKSVLLDLVKGFK